MAKTFLKKEFPFILALAALVLCYTAGKSSFILSSFLFETLMFFVIFGVIIYAAIGVVRHAEFLARKLGEPYGTMVLTFSAVTVEIIMVATMMLNGDEDPLIARETIYSTLMILLNGLTGFIMLIGGLKYGDQKYNLKSSNSYFSLIFAVVGLGLILPQIIKSEFYSVYEIFLVAACLLMYIFFVRMQSKEHNYYFKFTHSERAKDSENLPAPKEINGWYHAIMLLLIIAAISVLAESLSVFVDDEISRLNLPGALAGVVIALIIVSPEGLTAIRAGLNDDMQRVMNISLGSMLSTVSLTIPTVLIVGMITHKDINLGLTPVQTGLIAVSLLVGIFSVKDGETNALQGFIHLILFLAFVLMVFI